MLSTSVTSGRTSPTVYVYALNKRIPSFNIFCGNLSCAGCYACANARKPGDELSNKRAAELLDEASGLGVNIVLLAGGEPLLSHGWLEALGGHSEMAGIVFTNGTLFDNSHREWLQEIL